MIKSEEIQAKQNDLRKLVGERYHDLIDVADSILRMQQICADCSNQLDTISGQVEQMITNGQNSSMFKDNVYKEISHIDTLEEKTRKVIELTDWVRY